jgi:hypothetical protein
MLSISISVCDVYESMRVDTIVDVEKKQYFTDRRRTSFQIHGCERRRKL